MKDLEDLIDGQTLKLIRGENSWEDEDTWFLGKGRTVVYRQKSQTFEFREKGKVLAKVPFDRIVPH